jgi:RIO kinase 1
MAKITREKFKTQHNVFDEFTNKDLYKLINEGHFDGLESPVKIGKEANIFSALKGSERVIVKIYRVNSCNFNKMFDYIKSDPRYVGLQGKRRSVILHWVQREYRNLLKAREAGVRVPKPIAIKNYILVMEFIGKGDEIAPALKDKQPEDISGFFKDIVLNMKKLYKAGLVHADLSAFNILNLDDKPVFIDFSQTSSLQDSRAQEYLSRDVRNVCMYFRKIGLKVNEEDVLKEIKSK